MQIDIYNVEKFIQVNNLKEVTNPILIERDNIPTVDGLLSTEIFGRTVEDRKEIFAYISLHEYFFNPYVYKVLKRLDRRFEEIIAGNLHVRITGEGEIVKDDNGQTGLPFLVKNFSKINLKKTSNSLARSERVDLINALKQNEIFVKHWVVQPAFYRDIQLDKMDKGKMSSGEENKMYAKLIRLCSALKNDNSGLAIVGDSTRLKVQNLLVEIYNNFIFQVKGKNGMFRNFVMGKSVDYGVRAVISTPLFKDDTPEDMEVSFYRCGLPLSMAVTNFFPFIVKWIKDFFYREIVLRKDNYPYRAKDGTIKYTQLTNVDQYNDEFITKNIDLYVHSYADRYKTIPLENSDGLNLKLRISGRGGVGPNGEVTASSTIINRAATWTDILFLAATEMCADKHVLITRYPLQDYLGIFPNKITVLSTTKTEPAVINSKFYKHYPHIDLEMSTSRVSTMFVETLNISNLYLKGLGGDYDGDQVTIRGVFTQEANAELDGLIRSKTNILNVSGSNIRSTENEALQTFYALTKDE